MMFLSQGGDFQVPCESSTPNEDDFSMTERLSEQKPACDTENRKTMCASVAEEYVVSFHTFFTFAKKMIDILQGRTIFES